MTEPTLRPLQSDEQATVCAWAMAEHWPGLTKEQPLTPDSFAQILVLPGHQSHALSEPGAAVAGFGQVWVAPNGSVNLVRLLVEPARRGQGLGKRLTALLLAEALRLPGSGEVRLRVRRENAPAVAIYRSLGFAEIETEGNTHVMAMAYRR